MSRHLCVGKNFLCLGVRAAAIEARPALHGRVEVPSIPPVEGPAAE